MARRWVVVLLAVLAVQVVGLGPAAAHAVLVSSNPADGQVLQTTPRSLELRFSEDADPAATVITLVDGAGRQVHPLDVLARDATIVATLPSLPEQTYRVTWRTVSRDDRHATSGVLVFGVGLAPAPDAGLPVDPAPDWREVGIWWALLVSTGAVLGGLLVGLLRRPAVADLRGAVSAVAALGGALAALAAPALFLVQAGGMSSARHLLGAAFGIRSVAREGCVLALLLLARRSRHRELGRSGALFAAVAAGGFALSSALLGHTASSPARTLLGALHLLAALTWFGTLWVLGLVALTALRRPHRRASLRRFLPTVLLPFGAVAVGSVATLIVTGLLLTGDSASTVDSLFTSVFGRLLLVKLGLALVAGLIGWHAHRTLRSPRAAVRLRLLSAESVALSLVLLAAAALSSAPPAHGRRFVPGTRITGSPTASAEADGLLESLSVGPNLPGRNFVSVAVFNSRRPAPAPIDAVIVRLDGAQGEQVGLSTRPDGSGAWVASTDNVDRPGAWTVTVTVLRRGLRPAVSTYDWRVGGSVGGPARRFISTADLAPLAGEAAGAVLACCAVALLVEAWRRRLGARKAMPTAAVVTEPRPELADASV